MLFAGLRRVKEDADRKTPTGRQQRTRQRLARLVHSLDEHLDRLCEGARSNALDIGLTREQLALALRDTLARNGMHDGAHIRLMVTRGVKRRPNHYA